ncbi:hypothetical protein D3C79_931470 [compost metagenome]
MLFKDDTILFVFFKRKIGFGREHRVNRRQLLGDKVGYLPQIPAFNFNQEVIGA